MLIPKTKNSIVVVKGSLSNCPLSYHPMIAISRGGFFVPRGRLSECSKEGLTKHFTPLAELATAETKFSLCERGHVVGTLSASGLNALYTRATLPSYPLHGIASKKNNVAGEKSDVLLK